jgi:large subunit ribosomal protein L4
MPTVDVWNLEHKKIGTLDLAGEVFGQEYREDLIGEAVRNQMARRRKGSASTKTRGTVSGTGAKPFKQKRTGRARQGTERAPHHVGGGKAFGPKPRSYAYRLPKKVRRKVLRSVLSGQARDNKLVVVKDFALGEIKTKRLFEILKSFGLSRALLVDAKDNLNLKLSARNIPDVGVRTPEGLNVVELLRFENIVISETSVRQLQEDLMP